MAPMIDEKQILKPKHSALGIIGFFIFLSSLIPIGISISILFSGDNGLPFGAKALYQVGFSADFFTVWLFLAPFVGFVLSIVDLRKPNRLKLLPKITVILASTIFALFIIAAILSAYNDVNRILSGNV